MWADAGGWAGVSACAGVGGDAGAGLCWPAASAGNASRINPERLRCFKGGLLIRPFSKGRIANAMGICSRMAWLGERGRTRRDIAGNFSGNDSGYGEIFKPVDRWGHFHGQQGSDDSRPSDGTNRTDVRVDGLGTQVQAAVKLRPEQNTRKESRQEKGEFGATEHFCRVSYLIIVHPERLRVADFRME